MNLVHFVCIHSPRQNTGGDVSQYLYPYYPQGPCLLLVISPHILLPYSWTDPPSRCGRQKKGSKLFPSFAFQMPKTGSLCPSTAGEASPGLAIGGKKT